MSNERKKIHVSWQSITTITTTVFANRGSYVAIFALFLSMFCYEPSQRQTNFGTIICIFFQFLPETFHSMSNIFLLLSRFVFRFTSLFCCWLELTLKGRAWSNNGNKAYSRPTGTPPKIRGVDDTRWG
ncbi:unnamed protein product, partial [Laminaria digitata]